MFGYIRPCKPELKVREWERFRQIYCGLCHTLGRRYGMLWRMALQYDMCFLVLLSSTWQDAAAGCTKKRCLLHPFRRRACAASGPALERAADATVILTRCKLRDTMQDERGWKHLAAAIAMKLTQRAGKKAAVANPALAQAAQQCQEGLNRAEQQREASMDRAADCFAQMMRALAWGEQERILSETLYHVGRFIYLLDAWDDLDDDLRGNQYNPVAVRFGLDCPDADREAAKAAMAQTLEFSAAAAASCAALLPEGPDRSITDNILYLGMPAVQEAVFAGTFQTKRKI